MSPVVMLGRVFGKAMSMAYGVMLGISFQVWAGGTSGSSNRCCMHPHYKYSSTMGFLAAGTCPSPWSGVAQQLCTTLAGRPARKSLPMRLPTHAA
eukprot:359622-Chlamydomonas_euryale.AAC.11